MGLGGSLLKSFRCLASRHGAERSSSLRTGIDLYLDRSKGILQSELWRALNRKYLSLKGRTLSDRPAPCCEELVKWSFKDRLLERAEEES